MRIDEVMGGTAQEGDNRLATAIAQFLDGRDPPDPPYKLMVGDWSGRRQLRKWFEKLGWGRMLVNSEPDPYEDEPWGLDNGAYTAWAQDRPFPEDTFLERVETARQVAEDRDSLPEMAVVPDRIGEGMESLEFSLSWIDRCQSVAPEFPWYLGLQEGMTFDAVRDVAHRFDGFLLGGGNRRRSFKGLARQWCSIARDHDINFHFARVSTRWALMHAAEVGADSADTAMPLFRVGDMRKFLGWYLTVCRSYE